MDSNAHSSPNASSSGSVSSMADSDKGPLWQYVTKVAKSPKGGGTWRFICNYCQIEKQKSYSRVRAHLLQIPREGIAICRKVGPNELLEMKRMEDEYVRRSLDSQPRDVPLACGSRSTEKKRKYDMPQLSPIARAFDVDTRIQLDQIIARMFYTGGLPFNLARNPYYMSSYTFAASHNLGGYVPPEYNKLITTLLQQEKANVERLLEPIKQTWPEKGITIVTDGWSDPQRRPLINFMATSGNGPMFLRAVNCAGEYNDKHFIANLMKKVIDDVGQQNVVQIRTDNAANYKRTGELIEGIYPHIYWTPCFVHTLNLALKNICAAKNVEANAEVYAQCHWITVIHEDAIQIKNYIMNHGMRLLMYNKFSTLMLLSVADTRFASVVVMLKRFKLLRRALEAMFMGEVCRTYREDDQGKAKFVREKVLSEEWWDDLTYILRFTAPMYDMIRVCDTNKPCLHLVYEMWYSMIEKVKDEIYNHELKDPTDDSDFYDKVYNILIARWSKSNTPLHCLAHSLNSRFYSDGWLAEDPNRRAPHRDSEVSEERMKCFRRLYPNDEDHDTILDEYANFSLKIGPFGDLTSLTKRSSADPKSWWANFGAQTPLLQALAFKVLRQPTSSSCAERNWSTYSFIHSLRRNKLNPKCAEDLVFIHNNLRLLSRNTDQYHDEKTKMWDIGRDDFGTLEDTGFLEFAELSLDEPELENVFFSDAN